jgi:DNA-binding PadR family transcriptional regulator
MKIQPSDTTSPRESPPEAVLTSAQFHILLTLAEGQRHGYAIMREVESRTSGALELGPGTLYRSLKQLLTRALIVEVRGREEEQTDAGNQRRCYALTREGKVRPVEEAQRLRALVRWAEDAMGLEGGQP